MGRIGGPGRKRAPKGQGEAEVALTVRVSRALADAAQAAADREGISLSEWWRRAGRAAVIRQQAGAPE